MRLVGLFLSVLFAFSTDEVHFGAYKLVHVRRYTTQWIIENINAIRGLSIRKIITIFGDDYTSQVYSLYRYYVIGGSQLNATYLSLPT